MNIKVFPFIDKFGSYNVSPRHPRGPATVSETSEDDAIVREKQFCGGLCCFKGCLAGTIGFVYFLLVIPTGILLTMHGSNNSNNVTLVIGLCLLIVPTVTMTTGCAIYQYRRYKRKCIAQEEKYKAEVLHSRNSSHQRY